MGKFKSPNSALYFVKCVAQMVLNIAVIPPFLLA